MITLDPVQTSHPPRGWTADWRFPLLMWALSRLVVVLAMALVAPHLSVPAGGHPPVVDWSLFARWDSGWYRSIVEAGYRFAPDGAQHSVAFFPLLPLLIGGATRLGLSFELAGTLINHLAFLGALVLLHRSTRATLGPRAACWAVAVMAWCPYSLYGSVIYTEGLFLLLTVGALWAFERQAYRWAGVLGALASATRVSGLMLLPAFAWSAWRDRRPVGAYLAAAASGLGLLAFSAYCAWRFGEPLAFLKAQAGWRTGLGFDWQGWLHLLTFGLTGPAPSNGGLKAVMLLGGAVLVWRLRAALPRAAVAYSLASLGLIVLSGSFVSIDRYVYGIAPLSLALGIALASRPRWGYLLLAAFGAGLAGYALRLAWGLWVA